METTSKPVRQVNIGILEISNKHYILTTRDELFKFSQAYALPDKTGKSLAVCDNRREFDNTILKELCRMF